MSQFNLLCDPISYAEKSCHPRHRHAAIVLYEGLLIAWANNNRNDHAEVRAVERAHLHGYRENLILISVAIDKKGKLKLAKPCMKCRMYLRTHKITNILYSTKQQTIVKL